ncbi:hypothetical protein [Deinococcus sp. UYEF24]
MAHRAALLMVEGLAHRWALLNVVVWSAEAAVSSRTARVINRLSVFTGLCSLG